MLPLIWVAAAAILALIILSVPYVQRVLFGKNLEEPAVNEPVIEREPRVIGGARRARGMRHRAEVRARLRAEEDVGVGDEEDDDEAEDEPKLPGKVGTKKLRKLQMKAEKKAMREQEEALREDRKKREALREKERQKEEEEERKRLEKQKLEEHKRRQEQEKKEQEEYLALKESFVVEEEGELEEEDSEKSFQEFINYIKKNKVVYLETLAAEFGLRTRNAISRVQSLQQSGDLTGVIDDRGKFIYISREELEAVAKFIKQRGRVSIAELVTSSNALINLQPELITTAT